VRVVFAAHLPVKEKLSNVSSSDLETWDSVDCIDGQAEAISLVLNSQL
jgi:hypothetical protein